MKKLPNHIPLFPLTGAILLPKGHLPLTLFEPRYLEMIEAAHDGDKMIGMIQPQRTNISSDPTDNDLFGTADQGRDLYNVGCVGLITEMDKTQDGRYFAVLTGVRRFEIIEELPLERPFREARISYANYGNDGDEQFGRDTKLRQQIIKKLAQYLQRLSLNIDLQSFDDLKDEELINSLAMICPFDAAEKQLLVEVPTLEERTHLMIKIMDFNLSKHAISSQDNIH